MSTESAIGGVAQSLDGVAKAINNHDATPTPTRKQFVRETAARLLSAHVGSHASMIGQLGEAEVSGAVKMADLVWEKTQQLGNS
jgi:hypothetical protein